MVHHWVTLEVTEAETRGERRWEGRHQAALFYADDDMVASSDPPMAIVGVYEASRTV